MFEVPLYFMVKTMVSCKFSQQNQSNDWGENSLLGRLVALGNRRDDSDEAH